MKRGLLALITGLGLLGALLLPVAASAQFVHDDTSSRVSSSQTIDDDLYIASRDVVIEGTVNGDVYAAGSTVTIKGTVNGDVFAAGQDVFIGGTVKGSVRTAGNTVRLAGANIGGGVSDVSQTLTVEKDTTIAGGMNFAAQTASLRAPIAKSLVGGGGEVTLSNSVGKDAELGARNLTLENGTTIAGSLHYYGNTQLHKQNGSVVQGETKQVQTQSQASSQRSHRQGRLLGIVWGVISLYLVGAALLWLLPKFITGVADTITDRPGASFGWGIITLIVTVPLLILLIITVIGIPLAVMGGLLFIAALYLSNFFVSLAIGDEVAKRIEWQPNPYADAFIGLVLLTLVELIPFVGAIVKLLVLIFGLGAVVVHKKGIISARSNQTKVTKA